MNKFTALFWGKICLLGGLVVFSAAAREDRPFAVKASQAAYFEEAIAKSIDQARETLDDATARYYAGLRDKARLFCTIRLADDAGHVEQVFVEIDKWESQVSGRISNQVRYLQGFAKGQTVTFDIADILDWTIRHRDGREEGNFIGKFLDAERARRAAAAAK